MGHSQSLSHRLAVSLRRIFSLICTSRLRHHIVWLLCRYMFHVHWEHRSMRDSTLCGLCEISQASSSSLNPHEIVLGYKSTLLATLENSEGALGARTSYNLLGVTHTGPPVGSGPRALSLIHQQPRHVSSCDLLRQHAPYRRYVASPRTESVWCSHLERRTCRLPAPPYSIALAGYASSVVFS